MATNQDAGGSPQTDSRYLIIVGALLLVIIGSLAALWMMERNRRITAENDLVAANGKMQSLQTALLGKMMAAGEGAAVPPINRRLIPSKEAQLGADRVRVFDVTSEAGRMIGFEPGDVIRVLPDQPPASGPSTAPAGG
jgi:hypothetical protein